MEDIPSSVLCVGEDGRVLVGTEQHSLRRQHLSRIVKDQ